MRVLAIVHQDDAGPGVFADAVRESGATLHEWRPDLQPAPEIDHEAVMVFGGAMNAHEESAYPWLAPEKARLRELVERGVPVLGVCLGAQLLAEAAGGSVRRAESPEIGWFEVAVAPEGGADPVLGGLPDRFTGFGWHSYEAVPPARGVGLASSESCLQAYRLDGAPAWGIQFHAEVDRATAEKWIRDYRNDEDAVAMGLDPDALLAQSVPRLGAWNELGRELCRRFLAYVGGNRPSRAPAADSGP